MIKSFNGILMSPLVFKTFLQVNLEVCWQNLTEDFVNIEWWLNLKRNFNFRHIFKKGSKT